MAFDLVIRNGMVVDGSGMTSYPADVGVTGRVITKVGRISERGHAEVDADGHAVTPGFIDGHTHMDAQVMWDPLGTCSVWHGITSVLMGNCGFTLAPANSAERALVVRNLERAEDISAEAMAAGIDWTWESFAEYLDAVERRPKGINYAGYVGHSALRTWAMGERGFTEESSEDDLKKMEYGLTEALRAGAFGMSTSRTPNHETSDNRPVASRLAGWAEVEHLVGTMGAMGGGLFELALEGAIQAPDGDPAPRAEALSRLRNLAVRTGATLMFGIGGRHWREELETIDAAATEGGRMYGQSHSRGASIILSFKTHLPFDKLPEWKAVRSLPLEEQRRAFSDPETRRRLVEAANRGDYGQAIGTEARPPEFNNIQVFENGLPPNPFMDELAAERRVDPVELMIDLALASDFDQLFIQHLHRSATSDDDLLEVMCHPRTVMTFSDSGAHVSQIMDASIQTHLLGHWVREKQVFTLEQAVRMITLAPAVAFGFTDRGLIREGMVADLNVFDPARIAPALPKVVYDLPGGTRRLDQRSVGIKATVVGGEVLIADGEHTGAFPGQLVRSKFAAI